MAATFDVTFRLLIDDFPADWLDWLRAQAGLPPGTAFTELDADLGVVGAQADKLYRSDDGLLHVEIQLSSERPLPDRALLYNVQAEHRHGGPVRSVLVLPRREANASTLTGVLRGTFSDSTVYLEFRYTVVRVWELPADPLLNGPLGTLPLAALTDDAEPRLPAVVARMHERFRAELPEDQVARTEAAVFVLLGMRYTNDVLERMFEGVTEMEESSTYQAIMRKGGVATLRRVIRRAGLPILGEITPEAETALANIGDLDRLERIAACLGTAETWDDLIAIE